MLHHARRPGFTLMELMIVLAIIVVVAAIMIPVSLKMTDRSFVPKAAGMLENALATAKSRAVAEKRPNGIRLVATDLLRRQFNMAPLNPAYAWYDQIQFIEDPGDYVENWIWGLADPPATAAPRATLQPVWDPPGSRPVPMPGEPPIGLATVTIAAGPFNFNALTDTGGTVNAVGPLPRNRLLFGPVSPLGGTNQWTDDANVPHSGQRLRFSYINNQDLAVKLQAIVQRGDRVEILGTGEVYTIEAVSAQVSGGVVSGDNVNIGADQSKRVFVPVLVLDRPLTSDVLPPMNGRPNFRIIRKPRVIAGIQPVKLPQEAVIDLTPPRTPLANNVDVNGNIYMSGVSSGIITSPISGLTALPSGVQEVAPLYVDILFSPSGELMPTAQEFGNTSTGPRGAFVTGPLDLIALWVHAHGSPDLWFARQPTAAQGNADNQVLVAVHARTGMIGSYPVATPANSTDPLAFIRAGVGRKSAETGP